MDEAERQAWFTSRDLNHARFILEARDPRIAAHIAQRTGQSETEVLAVLNAARDIHTRWPCAEDQPPV